jgi:hypothetical protein
MREPDLRRPAPPCCVGVCRADPAPFDGLFVAYSGANMVEQATIGLASGPGRIRTLLARTSLRLRRHPTFRRDDLLNQFLASGSLQPSGDPAFLVVQGSAPGRAWLADLPLLAGLWVTARAGEGLRGPVAEPDPECLGGHRVGTADTASFRLSQQAPVGVKHETGLPTSQLTTDELPARCPSGRSCANGGAERGRQRCDNR